MPKTLITSLALALTVFIGSGCGTSTVTNTTVTNTAITNTTGTADLENITAGAKTFDITAQQFDFDPSTITVNEGDTVTLNITSTDVPHGFALPDFGVAVTLTPHKTKTVTFVADQKGTFSFTCNVVCGSGHTAMTGNLIVQ